MAPTISLTEDAYEQLDRHRREEESFSDVVRRLTSDGTLSAYYGRLDEAPQTIWTESSGHVGKCDRGTPRAGSNSSSFRSVRAG